MVGVPPRLIVAALALVLAFGTAEARELRFEFQIDAQMAGSRPWDGTGVSSAAIDMAGDTGGDGAPGLFGGLGTLAGPVLQSGLDMMNQNIAPPDPYICVVTRVQRDLSASVNCTMRANAKRDATQVTFNLESYADLEIFGVALLDSDFRKPGGRRH